MAPGLFGATLIHDYKFEGSLADTLGGPALVANGGTIGATSYTFNANQGLSLSNGFTDATDYSIVLRFSLANTTAFAKIIDFIGLTSDNGLYAAAQGLYSYSDDQGTPGLLPANTLSVVVLTRDSATNNVNVYINGANAGISFTDLSNRAVFSAANNIAWFFRDDNGGSEATSGSINRLQIYNGDLTAGEVSALDLDASNGGGQVPEPSTVAFLTIGALALPLARRFRKN